MGGEGEVPFYIHVREGLSVEVALNEDLEEVKGKPCAQLVEMYCRQQTSQMQSAWGRNMLGRFEDQQGEQWLK